MEHLEYLQSYLEIGEGNDGPATYRDAQLLAIGHALAEIAARDQARYIFTAYGERQNIFDTQTGFRYTAIIRKEEITQLRVKITTPTSGEEDYIFYLGDEAAAFWSELAGVVRGRCTNPKAHNKIENLVEGYHITRQGEEEIAFPGEGD